MERYLRFLDKVRYLEPDVKMYAKWIVGWIVGRIRDELEHIHTETGKTEGKGHELHASPCARHDVEYDFHGTYERLRVR